MLAHLPPPVAQSVGAVGSAQGHRPLDVGLRAGHQFGDEHRDPGPQGLLAEAAELLGAVDHARAERPGALAQVRERGLGDARVGELGGEQRERALGADVVDPRSAHARLRGEPVERRLVHHVEVRRVGRLERDERVGDARTLVDEQFARGVRRGHEHAAPELGQALELLHPRSPALPQPGQHHPFDVAAPGDPGRGRRRPPPSRARHGGRGPGQR